MAELDAFFQQVRQVADELQRLREERVQAVAGQAKVREQLSNLCNDVEAIARIVRDGADGQPPLTSSVALLKHDVAGCHGRLKRLETTAQDELRERLQRHMEGQIRQETLAQKGRHTIIGTVLGFLGAVLLWVLNLLLGDP